MDQLIKIRSLLGALLISTSSAWGQNSQCSLGQEDCEQKTMQNQMIAGYNAPERIDIKRPWDLYAVGSFTYWQAIQDNMELGVVSDNSNPVFAINGNVVNIDFEYKPGFEVGFGMNFDRDNWDTFLQYSWFRGTDHTRTTLNPSNASITLFPMWGEPEGQRYFAGTEKWRLRMDLLDWELARRYYVGTQFSLRPFFALRAAWIRQNVNVDYLNEFNSGANVFINQKSRSWALGPRVGLDSHWMLGQNLRIYGNASGDILFSRYTKLQIKQEAIAPLGTPINDRSYFVRQRDTNTLKTHLDLELGFGWGSYLNHNHTWYMDLSAGYEWQVFFDQNMFRSFMDDLTLANSRVSKDNLYVHGLTANIRFDF